MSSGYFYQCSSMDDEDDDAQGLSPTSPWRKNMKMKDYSDNEEEDEEQEDLLNIKLVRELKQGPIPIALVRVIPPSTTKKQTALINSGKAPRNQLSSKNPCANLNHREFIHILKKDLPGEWGHKLLKKEPRGSTPEWKPCDVAGKLWDDLDRTARDFQQAYGLLRGVLRDLEIHYGHNKFKKKEDMLSTFDNKLSLGEFT
jgi:hypothetical protein